MRRRTPFEDKTLAQGESITTAYGNAAYLLDPEGFGSGDATANASYGTSTAAPGDVQMMTAVARDVNGDYCLTNAELQIYYWMEFYQLMNSYGSYVAMLGLDYTQPLSQQAAPTRRDLGAILPGAGHQELLGVPRPVPPGPGGGLQPAR